MSFRWPWTRRRLQGWQRFDDCLEAEQHERLRSGILQSPWLAATTLNQRFAATWGFSVAFREDGLAEVHRSFPEFVPYLNRVIRPGRENAFFLNPLVIFQGGGVMPHIDCSLRSYTLPLQPPYPERVSVYYAHVPAGLRGGNLVLTDGRQRVLQEIQPADNVLVEFEGSLMHHVTPFQGEGEPRLESSRISLVCEQYRLEAPVLARVPRFHLESTRPFADFFDSALETAESGNEA